MTHLKREDTTMLIYVHKTPILGTDIGIQRASQSVVETGPTEGGGSISTERLHPAHPFCGVYVLILRLYSVLYGDGS